MKTRNVTRTAVVLALMLNLGVAGVHAQQKHVKMTFSGTNVAMQINLQVTPSPTKRIWPVEVRLGHSRSVNSTQTGPRPRLPTVARGRTLEC